MSQDQISASSHITPVSSALSRGASFEALSKYAIIQESSEEEFSEWAEQAFNPLAIARRFATLETRTAKRKEEPEKTDKDEKKVQEIKRLEAVSEQYQRKNEELQTRSLLLLRARISDKDTKEEILRKVLELYHDYSLADEAFDFLLETTEGELAATIREAKKELNELYGREIRAGRNIHQVAREFSAQGLGSPTAWRDVYRDVTGNPREPADLFSELSSKFSYEKMSTIIELLLNSLGKDLKSKGPSIARAELYRLMTETRTLQAILGVYRFFKARMRLIASSFAREGLVLPEKVTFEMLAKLFVKFLQERYPHLDKVLQLAALLDISEEIAAQIILFTQMRDGVRQVAPKLFKSDQHKQDVLVSFMEALEELDEKLEEKEEK